MCWWAWPSPSPISTRSSPPYAFGQCEAAREALMSRHWPAMDVASLLALIDDPRHALQADGTYRLSSGRRRRSSISASSASRLWAATKSATNREDRGGNPRIPRHSVLARPHPGDHPRRTHDHPRCACHPAPDEIIEPKAISRMKTSSRGRTWSSPSHAGYIKRVPLSTYRAQRRGGKGRSGMQTRDEDFVTRLFVANTHIPLLFFSSRGQSTSRRSGACRSHRERARQIAEELPAFGRRRAHHHHRDALPEDEAPGRR